MIQKSNKLSWEQLITVGSNFKHFKCFADIMRVIENLEGVGCYVYLR
jgi:hypothetical protein